MRLQISKTESMRHWIKILDDDEDEFDDIQVDYEDPEDEEPDNEAPDEEKS